MAQLRLCLLTGDDMVTLKLYNPERCFRTNECYLPMSIWLIKFNFVSLYYQILYGPTFKRPTL